MGPSAKVVALVVLIAMGAISADAQLSEPIVHNDQVTKASGQGNKFLDRKSSPDSFDDEEAMRRGGDYAAAAANATILKAFKQVEDEAEQATSGVRVASITA